MYWEGVAEHDGRILYEPFDREGLASHVGKFASDIL